ncbi:uncharacterized protein LOC127618357 isoform X2 [Xyrauchen texanus]|uniref:uncharacterized protein LOC127618357 isoform X2 n=1 Tax=Xyrauchen texanus TaxID=154827 RepID=UPI0022423BF7|nr:uncharacterized protein LOC127618357 isoform X2 [Xyrauchen texanus]
MGMLVQDQSMLVQVLQLQRPSAMHLNLPLHHKQCNALSRCCNCIVLWPCNSIFHYTTNSAMHYPGAATASSFGHATQSSTTPQTVQCIIQVLQLHRPSAMQLNLPLHHKQCNALSRCCNCSVLRPCNSTFHYTTNSAMHYPGAATAVSFGHATQASTTPQTVQCAVHAPQLCHLSGHPTNSHYTANSTRAVQAPHLSRLSGRVNKPPTALQTVQIGCSSAVTVVSLGPYDKLPLHGKQRKGTTTVHVPQPRHIFQTMCLSLHGSVTHIIPNKPSPT